VVVRGRWARAERLLVCRRARSGAFKKHAPRSGRIKNSDAWWVVWLRCGLDRRARLSCLLRCGTSDLLPASETAGPWGAREADCRGRLPRDSAGAGIGMLRIQGETMPEKLARPHCVCEQRWCAWGVATARQSNFSQLNLSVVPGESISSPTRLQIVCKVVVNASQQYERLLSLATAKM
jgi:hypothetical protein